MDDISSDMEKHEQLQSTTAELRLATEKLLNIESTIGWRILKNIYRAIDRIFPSGTKRKNIYYSVRRGFIIILLLPEKVRAFLSGDYFLNRQKINKIPIPRQEEIFVGEGGFENIGNEFLDYFVTLGGLKKTDTVLDVGCGIGRMARPLTQYLDSKGTYYGFDVVRAGIDWCNKNIGSQYKNFNFQHVNLKNLMYNPQGESVDYNFRFPFSSETFDFIFLTSVFTHMEKEGVIQYVNEIHRTIKKGGRCFVTFFLINDEFHSLIKSGTNTHHFNVFEDYYIVDEKIPETAVAYNEEFVVTLFKSNGFSLRETKYGSWCGREKYMGYQDILIFEKE